MKGSRCEESGESPAESQATKAAMDCRRHRISQVDFRGGRGIATIVQGCSLAKGRRRNATQGVLPRSQLTSRAHFRKPLLKVSQ